MKYLNYILSFLFTCSCLLLKAQNQDPVMIVQDSIVLNNSINPQAPAKAAFYSAVIPGLGQAYNKQYWKIPVVYVAIGTSAYFYVNNNQEYHRYRDAYKRRLAGFNDDEFQGDKYLDNDRLIYAQKIYQKQRDLSMLITIGFYILNIVDANVSAHLKQFNVNDNLSLSPEWYRDDLNLNQNLGVSLKYRF